MAERELSFGEYLTQLREAKDVTLRELARKIGVSAPFLSDVEKNRRAPLTAERLEKVAAVLGLSEEEKAEMYEWLESNATQLLLTYQNTSWNANT